jgi:hypothetical protein
VDFTALHRHLGCGPGPLTNGMLDEAVAIGLAETDDLDWKKDLPAASRVTQSDFPKDVAAMANIGGGVIVYGITEQQKEAQRRVDVGELDETHERTLRSAAVTAISPPVLHLGFRQVGDPGQRAVIVVIPPSIEVPHLVYRNDYFGAPRRNNADTVWMRERDIEAMYRARFDERRASTAALLELYDEAAAGRDTTQRAWLVGVARPRVLSPLRPRMTRDEARGHFQRGANRALTIAARGQIGRHLIEFIDMANPRAGLRRWTAPSIAPADTASWADSWASVHDDGSVSVATAVGGQRWRYDDGVYRGNRIEEATLECCVADLLALVWQVSRERASGDYEVQLGVEFSGPGRLIIQTSDQFGMTYDHESVPLARFTPVRATLRTDVDFVTFHEQCRDLALDVVNQGGVQHLQLISTAERDEASAT